MNTLKSIIIFLLNAVEQKSLLSVISCITGIYPPPLVTHQSVSRLLNGVNRLYFLDFLILLRFYTLAKYNPLEKHNNTNPNKTMFLIGKNKFIS